MAQNFRNALQLSFIASLIYFMGIKIDLKGKRFGRWIVIEEAKRTHRYDHSKWLCKCECGKVRIVIGKDLRRGQSKSCGCYQVERIKEYLTTHGQIINHIPTPEYQAWCEMKKRCLNKKSKSYNRYGGRGIKVCDRWLNSFENFFEDMGKKPSLIHSLDRIENNGNYEPANCRWATNYQQSRNRRSNKWIEFNKERMVFKDWSIRLGVSEGNLKSFLKNNSFEKAYNHYMNI